MSYMVESDEHGEGWHIINSTRAGNQVFENLEQAINSLKNNADNSLVVWPMRVVDSEGNVYKFYDPDRDTRLPGCRWRIIQRSAYHLWEEAGRPSGDGREFWKQAEQELVENDGIYDP